VDSRLSDDDLEILDHILAGRTDREIAEHLSLDITVAQQSITALVDQLMSPGREVAPVDGDATLTGGKHRRTV